jgi:hypothetical protein
MTTTPVTVLSQTAKCAKKVYEAHSRLSASR